MPRPRLHSDVAAKQRAYRQRLKARRQALRGPTDADLAQAVRALHMRLEYVAATQPQASASGLLGKDPLETFRNAIARLTEEGAFS